MATMRLYAAAAVVAGLMWIVLAKGLGLLLGRYLFAGVNERLSTLLPLLFGIGVHPITVYGRQERPGSLIANVRNLPRQRP